MAFPHRFRKASHEDRYHHSRCWGCPPEVSSSSLTRSSLLTPATHSHQSWSTQTNHFSKPLCSPQAQLEKLGQAPSHLVLRACTVETSVERLYPPVCWKGLIKCNTLCLLEGRNNERSCHRTLEKFLKRTLQFRINNIRCREDR